LECFDVEDSYRNAKLNLRSKVGQVQAKFHIAQAHPRGVSAPSTYSTLSRAAVPGTKKAEDRPTVTIAAGSGIETAYGIAETSIISSCYLGEAKLWCHTQQVVDTLLARRSQEPHPSASSSIGIKRSACDDTEVVEVKVEKRALETVDLTLEDTDSQHVSLLSSLENRSSSQSHADPSSNIKDEV
jgi:hypothetical protein